MAFIAGGSAFEVQGQTSFKETLAGYVALTLFCAVCQLFLTRRGRGGLPVDWQVLGGMVVALLAARALGFCPNWPQFVAAACGAVAGAVGHAVLSRKQLHI